MTHKQILFVAEYAKSGNATRAAQKAGYSPKTAYSQGSELLKKPEIKKAIQEKRELAIQNIDVTKDWWLQEVVRIAKSSGSDTAKIKSLELIGKHLNVFANEMTLISKMDDDELDKVVGKIIDKMDL